jgi:aryl-alcohol dehydrogenase-like predicted oxidoreductase
MREAGDLGSRFEAFAEVGRRHDASAQQVCLAWELAKSAAMIPIPGASRPESVADSAQAVAIVLEDDDFALLDAAG